MNRTNLTSLCIVVVMFAWIGSLVLGWLDHSYKMPGTVELAMASVVGYLLGTKWLQGAKSGEAPDGQPVEPPRPKSKSEKKRWYDRS